MNGTVIYEVIGWHTTVDHIGYLAPMLFVNLASLIVIIIAMHRASGHASADDPTNPKILLVAIRDPEGKEPNEMTDKVVFRRRDVRCLGVNLLTPSADFHDCYIAGVFRRSNKLLISLLRSLNYHPSQICLVPVSPERFFLSSFGHRRSYPVIPWHTILQTYMIPMSYSRSIHPLTRGRCFRIMVAQAPK